MSQLLKITLCGAPTITLAEQPLTALITGKALALFAYLAVNRQPHARDLLADLLWSEFNNQQARNNLRYLLPDLRRLLERYLIITPQTIGFNHQAPYWLDVEVLQTTLTTQVTALKQENLDVINLPLLQKALDLYQGKFLAGFTVRNASVFAAWVAHQENQLHSLVIQGFYSLAAAYFQQGQIQAGLTASQRLLQWEPWHEAGHRLHMRLLVANGQRSAALAQYDLCRQMLAGELGVAPESATTALFEAIRSGVYDKVTSDRVTSDKVTTNHAVTPLPPHLVTLSLPHNLPGQLTPFVGRAAEIDDLCTLLADPTRPLITLTGLGGIGKTRLALAVAQRILDLRFLILDSNSRVDPITDNQKLVLQGSKSKSLSWKDLKFPDGVWFVRLIGIADGENLADRLAVAIMETLQLPRSGPLAPVEQLLDALCNRNLLLILDNFEHLLAGVDLLYTLLQRTQQVKVLVTSRQNLNLQAEFVWQVAGLTTPETPALFLKPPEILRYDSVALFVERAQYADHTFRLDERNQAEILQICRFVEGLPLGIELAAAMLRYYSCRELWQRLQQDYRVLAVTQRDLPPRHRTITALFDFSWHYLTSEQSRALTVCTIFPHSFSVEAAGVIADATHATLFALIDQSLLKQSAKGTFELHELVRHYAAAKLKEDPQLLAQVRRRHAYYYAGCVEPDAATLLRSPAKINLIQQELPNLRLAWRWAITAEELWPLRQMGQGLFIHFLAHGPLQEGWDLCDMALDLLQRLPTAALHPDDRSFLALTLAAQSYWGYYLGRYAEAAQLASKAIAMAEPVADGLALALANLALGWTAFTKGDFTGKESFCQKAVAAARTGAVPFMVAVSLAHLGFGLTIQGKAAEAITALDVALHLIRAEQFTYLEGYILGELGFVYAMTGDWALADGTTQQALQLNQGLNNSLNRGYQYERLALAAEALGDYERALAWTEQALVFNALVPDPVNQLSVLLVRGRALRYLHQVAEAEAICQQLLLLAHNLGRQTESAQAQVELGHVALAQQQWPKAERHYYAALALAATGQFSCQAAAQAGLAQVQWQQKQVDKALAWVEQSEEILLTQALESQYDAAFAAITCYQLLAVSHERRAAAILQRAYGWVTMQSLKISDENLRCSFLTKAPYHRQLQTLMQAAEDKMAESRSTSS